MKIQILDELIESLDTYDFESYAMPEDSVEISYGRGINEGVRMGEEKAVKRLKAIVLIRYAKELERGS
ncbi:MAG: hypothetical protein AAF636_11470 [Pseudomonadota bacterium]